MSCTNITTCFRIGTDYKDRLITPTDGLGGLSDFRYEIKNQLGGLVKNLTVGAGLEIVGDKIVIQGDALEDLPVGKYDAVFWLDINGQTRDLFSEDLEISADKCDCQNLYNLAFTIIPVDISENVVNIYLSWEDLTPEQILELQQPAIDAGNEVRQQVDDYIDAKELQINPVILAAENATQGANDAAQTANTAAENADEKATAAQTAANNANEAKTAAETATQEANDATTAANTAAGNANDATTAANTAAGNAQSAANDANDINNAVQLAENTRISNETTRVNQESTRQTNESGRVTAEGTRVSAESLRVGAESSRVTAENTRVSAENTRISNETTRQNQEGTRQTNETTRINAESGRVSAENTRVSAENARVLAEANRQGRELVAAVTLNNSFEIKIQSIDYATGIFTTTAPHGLTSGSRLSPILDLNSGANFLPAVLPDGLAPGQYTGGLIIHDTTRFSINGVTMTSHAGVDFSKWHFENANGANHISLTGLAADYYEVEILGRILNQISYLAIITNRVNLTGSTIAHLVASGASGSTVALNRSNFLQFPAHVYYSGRITIDGRNGLIVRQEAEAIVSQTGANAKTQNVYYTDKAITLDSRMTSGATQISSIQTSTGTGFANGTKVFLYKRK